MKKLRIGTLVSGGGTNLQAIIDACIDNRLPAEVVFTGTDNPTARGLERARKAGIPTFVVDYANVIRAYRNHPEAAEIPPDFDLSDIRARQSLFPPHTDPAKTDTFLVTRAMAEAMLLEKMKAYPFDLLVLAGFMRNFSPYLIDRINTDPARPRIMNIHPALLPAFPGTDGYGDTFRYGCKVGGCTVHFIDYGEDSGPIIGQMSFAIAPEDTIDTVREKGLALEWQLYPQCIRMFAENRLEMITAEYPNPDGRMRKRTTVRILPSRPEHLDDEGKRRRGAQ